jgi:hypothetical protein
MCPRRNRPIPTTEAATLWPVDRIGVRSESIWIGAATCQVIKIIVSQIESGRGKALKDTFVRQPSIVFPIPFLMVDRYRYESWNRSFSNDTPQLSREQIGPCHRRLLGHNRVSVSRIAHAMHGRMGNDAIDRQWLQIKKIAAIKNWIAPSGRRPMSFKLSVVRVFGTGGGLK